jgi:hypothetical protein
MDCLWVDMVLAEVDGFNIHRDPHDEYDCM